jgi:DNA adenine methylase
MIKTPLRYPGGKSRAVRFLTNLIPIYNEFREPFLGGGSVFINLKQIFPERLYWVNDLYFDLYNLWIQTQTNVNEVIREIREIKSNFIEGKELYSYLNSNYREFEPIRKAAAFFIYNRITFSGTTESGGYSEGSYVGRFTESSINRLSLLGSILGNTTITNLDYKELITAPGNDVVIFLDPPYYSAKKSALYGKNGNMHKYFDYESFADVLRVCEHRWLITLDDSPFIRELFTFANINPWNLTYGMRNQTEDSDQIGKELIISNYVTEQNIRSSLEHLTPNKKARANEPTLFL